MPHHSVLKKRNKSRTEEMSEVELLHQYAVFRQRVHRVCAVQRELCRMQFMARYFFNVRDNENYEEDVVGAEFSSAAVAIGEANLAAREMVAAKVLAGEVIDGQVFKLPTKTAQL